MVRITITVEWPPHLDSQTRVAYTALKVSHALGLDRDELQVKGHEYCFAPLSSPC